MCSSARKLAPGAARWDSENGNSGVLISRKNGDPGSHFHGCMGIGIPDFWTHFPAKTGLYKS